MPLCLHLVRREVRGTVERVIERRRSRRREEEE
jgi:hypothetical protein